MAEISPRLRVLVVEDELLIRWSIAETLGHAGHTVIEAENGAAAVRALKNSAEAVDAVMLDYRLPDSNDLTLLAAIRRLSPGSGVILMTAHGTPEVTKGALDLGAYEVMHKPFEIHDLEPLLLKAFASSGFSSGHTPIEPLLRHLRGEYARCSNHSHASRVQRGRAARWPRSESSGGRRASGAEEPTLRRLGGRQVGRDDPDDGAHLHGRERHEAEQPGPGPEERNGEGEHRGRDRRPQQQGTRPAAPRGPPRAQDEHDAELGEQRHHEPRRLECGLTGTEEQKKRGEGQEVEDGADEPEHDHVAPDLRDVPALRVRHALGDRPGRSRSPSTARRRGSC